MITITIYNNIKLVITPMEWFVWPIFKRDWGKTYHVKQLEIAYKFAEDTEKNYRTHYVTRRAQTNFYIWILFVQIHFPSWWTCPYISTIYPEDYDWRKDPDYDKKYKALAATDYFC